MDKSEKVKVISKLYNLLNFYSENRDQPVEGNFNFFDEVKSLCDLLDIDFEEFKIEFGL